MKCEEEYDECSCEEKDIDLSTKYTYKFIKNKDFDLIEVESRDKRSTWYGETRTFPDYYFKKAK